MCLVSGLWNLKLSFRAVNILRHPADLSPNTCSRFVTKRLAARALRDERKSWSIHHCSTSFQETYASDCMITLGFLTSQDSIFMPMVNCMKTHNGHLAVSSCWLHILQSSRASLEIGKRAADNKAPVPSRSGSTASAVHLERHKRWCAFSKLTGMWHPVYVF